MKPRFAIYALVLVLVVLAVLCGRRPLLHLVGPEAAPMVQATSNVPEGPAANVRRTSQGTPSVAPETVSSQTTPGQADPNDMRSPEGFRRSVEKDNVPLDFYGQVIDQDSNALSGVRIKVAVQQVTVPDPTVTLAGTKELPLERITGADGRFEISGFRGYGFALESIQKDGYEAEPRSRGFGSSEGSFSQPVLFKMWSTNIHEKLISGHKAFDIVPDGRPYVIDLAKGAISESGRGDLKVWIRCPAQMVRGETYDWSCEIDAINGGLLEEPLGVAMYSAPDEGYTPSFHFQGRLKGGQRGSPGERCFYLRLNNGQEYGAISIEPCAPYNNKIPGLIRLSYAINPSGSRVLR